MRKFLTRAQKNVLLIMVGGKILFDLKANRPFLEDSEGGDIYINPRTFQVLLDEKMIEFKYEPALGIQQYIIAKRGGEYLMENYAEKIKKYLILKLPE